LCMPSVFWMRLRTRSPMLKEVSLALDHDSDIVVGHDELVS
jgi:hypothetical protein